MPRIPACSEVLAKLAVSHLDGSLPSSNIAKTLQEYVPKPYILTRERLENKKNYILNLMGQETNKTTLEEKMAQL
jgi:hypothetical protein